MLRLRVVLRHERAVGSEAREHGRATVFPVDDDRLADIRLDARDVDALPERLAGAGPDAADGENAPTKSPTIISAKARAITTSAMNGPKRANRDGGSTEPSRTAAIGCTRVARSAGRIDANSVTTAPSTSEMTTVRVAKTVPTCGRSMPNATNSALSPLASPRPRKRPTTEPSIPVTNASITTDQYTWRFVAPSVRSVASSRMRCAIVIDIVLAITKMPTNSATNPNARRKYSRIVRKAFVSFAACFASSCPVRTWAAAGRSRVTSRTSWPGETFGLPAMPIESSFPSLPEIRFAVGRSNTVLLAPPSDETP